jgi:hypothetical protein
MKAEKDVAERFPKDIAEHEMHVLRNDGLDRHLRFQKPGTYCMGFDLVTWHGHLCFTGDMGTFVFARIPDMFQFFRAKDERGINPQYWSEKVLAADRHGGVEEFSPELFRAAIGRWLDDGEASPEVREAVEEQVLSAVHDGEHAAHAAAFHFEHPSGFRFEDFWEADCRDYTYRFIWCCHALVWAIATFDEKQKTLAAIP